MADIMHGTRSWLWAHGRVSNFVRIASERMHCTCASCWTARWLMISMANAGIYLNEHRNYGGSRKVVVTIHGQKSDKRYSQWS